MSRVDDITAQLLSGKPVTGKTIYHKTCNDMMHEYLTAVAADDTASFRHALMLKAQIRTAVIMLNYRPTDTGMNPKEVPTEHLRYAMTHPIMTTFLSPEQLKRVDSPIKGIRAFCMNCQGNDTAGVRECAAINCPLHPFRMGVNSFYGRLSSSESETTDAELELEMGEDDDADQTTV